MSCDSQLRVFAARLRRLFPLIEGPSLPQGAGCDKDNFGQLALELFALQFDHNPAYQRLCAARGLEPGTVTSWEQIPAVPTAAFKEWDVSCLPPEQRTAVFHSSGTTEQRPSRHFHSAESLALYTASVLPWFKANCLQSSVVRCPLAILTPPAAIAPHSSLVCMFEAIRREFGSPESRFLATLAEDGAWTLDLQAVVAALREAVESKRPLFLLGTAFLFVHLLDYLAETELRFELPHGSRALETGGYKGRSRVLPKTELHTLLTERLGLLHQNILCEYGMSELSSQAYDSPQVAARNTQHAARPFRFPPWTRPQIISPETGREVAEGETGLIRVFDLANVYSVMAIQTEDLGVRRGGGFELVGRASLAEPRGCSLMAR